MLRTDTRLIQSGCFPAAALKNTVTLNEKEITLDEFNEMMK